MAVRPSAAREVLTRCRWQVVLVLLDGDPEVVDSDDDLRVAHDLAEALRESYRSRGHRCFVAIQDRDIGAEDQSFVAYECDVCRDRGCGQCAESFVPPVSTGSLRHDPRWDEYFDSLWRKDGRLFKPVTIIDKPAVTIEDVHTGETYTLVIGSPLYDGFERLVPKGTA